jgi:hypothetical protein
MLKVDSGRCATVPVCSAVAYPIIAAQIRFSNHYFGEPDFLIVRN